MNKLKRLKELKATNEDMYKYIKEMYYDEDEQEPVTIETILGLTIEKIAFMKQYFKELGFDPESDDFEQNVLLYQSPSKKKTEFINQIYTYQGEPTSISYTYSVTEGKRRKK